MQSQSQPPAQDQQPPTATLQSQSQSQPQQEQQHPPATLQSPSQPQSQDQQPPTATLHSQPPAAALQSQSQSQSQQEQQQPPPATLQSLAQSQPQSQDQQPPTATLQSSSQPPAAALQSQSQPQPQQEQQPPPVVLQTSLTAPIIDLRDSDSDDEVDTEDVDVASDACIPIEILKNEAKTYMSLAELYGNFRTAPASVDIDYGGETHKLNSFHYRGNSRVRDATSTGRASSKKAYIDENDTKDIIYRWEIMGCLTTMMKYKVKIMITLRRYALILIFLTNTPLLERKISISRLYSIYYLQVLYTNRNVRMPLHDDSTMHY